MKSRILDSRPDFCTSHKGMYSKGLGHIGHVSQYDILDVETCLESV